jgi:hypothetical protein
MSRRDITFDDALPERRAVQRCASQTQCRFTGGIGCLGKERYGERPRPSQTLRITGIRRFCS